MARKPDTLQDHQERLNRVLAFIQDHLDESLTLDALAKVACYSPFHFHRVFAAFVGESVSAHLRRIRLEHAAHRLRHTKRSVTDIALQAGFETPASFNKAFRQHFRTTPSRFRARKTDVDTRPKPFRLIITQEAVMQPEIRTRSEKTVLFVRRVGKYHDAATDAWSTVCGYAFPRGLVGKGAEFIGVGHDDPSITPENKLRYDACITVDRPVKPEGEVGVTTLKGGTYAVFLHQGPYENLNRTYQSIYRDWLPGSGRKLRDCACFEIYLNDPQRTKPENLRTEICVPIE